MTYLSGSRWVLPDTRLYQTVNDICLLMDAIMLAGEVVLKLKHSLPLLGETFTMPCRQFPIVVAIPCNGPIYLALRNDPRVPNYQVTFGSKEDSASEPARHSTMRLSNLQNNVFTSQLIIFWARHSEWIQDTYKRPDDFPPVLRFLWVMRGCAAHGGLYNYNDAKRPPVIWHNLAYTSADVGRHVFGQDLSGADILVLLFEAADELDRLGAPN
jgi:hypothetical protein